MVTAYFFYPGPEQGIFLNQVFYLVGQPGYLYGKLHAENQQKNEGTNKKGAGREDGPYKPGDGHKPAILYH
jgi:hypothetical protein